MIEFPENRYLSERTLYGPFILDSPPEDLALIVVIPSHVEPQLEVALRSLSACQPLENGSVEVIVVLNESEDAPSELRLTHEAQKLRLESEFEVHILHPPSLPRKHAGVGLARKIGMDEACRRFEVLGRDGIIVCFDADSQCTPNHFRAIHAAFENHPKAQAASIHFEHPLEGDEFPPEIFQAIAEYELHLRCFIGFQKKLELPYAIQTIGSSMAVRSRAYQAQNGMNRRKAGEDFYFLHKFTALGKDAVIEIDDTMVIPSPRTSGRVPFGTGKAVGDLLEEMDGQLTYAPLGFHLLSLFIQDPENCILSPEMRTYLESINFRESLTEIRKNTASEEAFRARFYRWFDAFKLMKFCHYWRDEVYPNVPVLDAANELLGKSHKSVKSALIELRQRK